MRHLSILLALLLCPLLCAAGPLDGKWQGDLQGNPVTVDLCPDGTYLTQVGAGAEGQSEEGTWRSDASKIEFSPTEGEPYVYAYSIHGGRLVLSGDDLPAPLSLGRAGAAPDDGTPPPPTDGTPPASGSPLVGQWNHEGQFMVGWIALRPDGKYSSSLTARGVQGTAETGVWHSDGSHLTIRCGGNEVTYDMAVEGEQMTLSGGNLATPLLYVKVPGSEKTVAEAGARADAERNAEDNEWRSRLAVGPLSGPSHVMAAGEVPEDEHWKDVQIGATVFTAVQGYVRFSTQQYMYRPGQGPQGLFRTRTAWLFLANGRVYVRAVQYAGSTKPDDVEQPWGGLYYIDGEDPKEYWGQYAIGADDSLHVVLDDTSTMDAVFTDGRRNMVWKETTYGNVLWENEALQNR